MNFDEKTTFCLHCGLDLRPLRPLKEPSGDYCTDICRAEAASVEKIIRSWMRSEVLLTIKGMK